MQEVAEDAGINDETDAAAAAAASFIMHDDDIQEFASGTVAAENAATSTASAMMIAESNYSESVSAAAVIQDTIMQLPIGMTITEVSTGSSPFIDGGFTSTDNVVIPTIPAIGTTTTATAGNATEIASGATARAASSFIRDLLQHPDADYANQFVGV
jgi:hypothetical protein